MTDGYHVPAVSHRADTLVRKSRFVAVASPASSREQALAAVDTMRGSHPQARHHCWACLIGDPVTASTAGSSDDGEPGGTAGRPILGVIQHKGIGDVVVVVSRYFGGVKLGAGGLVRAYAGAAESVLAGLELAVHRPMRRVELRLGFAQEQPLRQWLENRDATLESVDYGEGVSVVVALPASELAVLDALCGRLGMERLSAPSGEGGGACG